MDGPLAVKPTLAVAPAASVALQLGAVTVTVVPLWVKVPFQPLPMVTPAGTVNETTHGPSDVLPVFLAVIAAW